MAKGTVIVRLKRDWFAPDGSLYQARDNPHEFPAAYAEEPSKRDGESDEDFKAREAASTFEVLPTTAEVVEGGKTVVVLQNTANGEQLKVPTAVEGDVDSVGGALDDKGLEQADQSVAEAEAGAKAVGMPNVGGKPRESGPLPAGEKKKN